MQLTKMHGIGNDYLFADCRETTLENPAELARVVSDRHFGIGADGLILILPSTSADYKMRMFNADGSEAQMCGNGIRCFAKWLFDRGLVTGNRVVIETLCGDLPIHILAENGVAVAATVNMGQPRLERGAIPMKGGEAERAVGVEITAGDRTFTATCLSMGNPHCVVFLDSLDGFDLHHYGPLFERHDLFPDRINTEFVQLLSPTELIQHTWERGSGETLACGTGAAAVCAAGVLTGRTERKITNHLKGGDLTLDWREADNCVTMTGPAVELFTTDWPGQAGSGSAGAKM